jgi:2'-5' RNA ligase
MYSLVAYVRSPLGQFVENLRNELHPQHAHLAAHITILPPRPLAGTEQQAMDLLNEVCGRIAPFEIRLGDVENFMPRTPTVFIRVAYGAYRMRELHDAVDKWPLQHVEPLPYMPHLTVAKLENDEQAEKVYQAAARMWSEYAKAPVVRIETLTFVRGREFTWEDVAPIVLGQKLVETSR